MRRGRADLSFFFFNDTATTEIYTLSLHDALPIYVMQRRSRRTPAGVDSHGREAKLEPRSQTDWEETARTLWQLENAGSFDSAGTSLREVSAPDDNGVSALSSERVHSALTPQPPAPG